MTIRLLTGDCRDVLPTLADASVHCCITSPPYFGLRDYQTATWDGGEAGCDHKQGTMRRDGYARPTSGPERGGTFAGGDRYFDGECGKCGAVRVDRQLGLESSPDAYLAAMVGVFREIRRVLRDDGTCWVNMGDSYAGNSLNRNGLGNSQIGGGPDGACKQRDIAGTVRSNVPEGLAAKQLLLMPARLALALQADGWWVRSDIIWAKPNPMPESCRDRPTSAHEHVFLLTKRARYFYDADAVREPSEEPWRSTGRIEQHGSKDVIAGVNNGFGLDGLRPREYNPAGRNLRNVWNIATHPYIHAHFATFPPVLAERCIRAGTSERGCCAACGAPWQRITDKAFVPDGKSAALGAKALVPDGKAITKRWNATDHGTWDVTTTGWSASCACGAETQPCTVLDPFAGSGTTLLVADRLQRHAIGIDLSTTYADMAKNRVTDDCPLFTSWAPAEDPEEERMRDLFAEAAE